MRAEGRPRRTLLAIVSVNALSIRSQARAISPQGHIVGVYSLANVNVVRSFLLVHGDFYPIDVTGQPHPSPSTYC